MTSRMIACLTVVVAVSPPTSAEPRFDVAWKVKAKGGFCGPTAIRDRTTSKVSGIVACEVAKGLACFAPNGKRVWSYAMSPPVTACPAVGDVDGNGVEDIVACDGKGNIVALTAGGKHIWSARTPGAVLADSCPAITDLDGDGHVDVLVGDVSGCVSCFDHTGKLRWQFLGEGGQMGPLLVSDIYDERGKEIIVTSHDGHIYAISAKGALLWDIYRKDDLFPNSTPILADVDGDGTPELYIGGGLHHFYRIDLRRHAITLEHNVLLHINAAISAADLDGDGGDEIVFGTKGGGIRCYGKDGYRWKRDLSDLHLGTGSSPVLVNLDDDPELEILFLASKIHAMDTDGSTLLDASPPGRIESPSLTGDLDNDGKMETIIAGHGMFGTNMLACLKWNVPYREDSRAWTVFAGNRAHTGRPASAKEYAPLPTPKRADKPSKVATFTPHGDVRLLTGSNRWRFDVANPEKRRLALLTDVAYPDGSVRHVVRHVMGAELRVVFDIDADATGTYRVAQTLMDVDRLAVLTAKTTQLEFNGLAGDRAYLEGVVFKQTADALDAWRDQNPRIARGMRRELSGLRGRLRAPAESGKKRDPHDPADLLSDAMRLRSLATAGQQLAPSGSFCAWRACPWGYFEAYDSVPSAGDKLDRLTTAQCVGEYESLAVNVTNLAPHAQRIRVTVGELVGKKKYPAEQHLTLRHAVTVPTVRRRRVADALPLLDQARLLAVPAMASSQLWITVNAAGLEPGNYTAMLSLKSLQRDPTELTIPIGITVHDLALPRPSPLRFCVWSYVNDAEDYELKDLVDHGVTVHFGNSPSAKCNDKGEIVGKIDFTKTDASVRRLSRYGILLFLGPQGGVSGQPFLSKPWRKAFVEYMKRWSRHMREIGMKYGDWALYPYDEPSTPYSATTLNLVEVAKLVRQADPNILIYTDPTSGTTMETVKMFTGLIDIWCPSSELLERLGDELIPAAKKVGKHVWMYDAAGGAKTLSCLGLYRQRFWYAWNQGFTGVGWWTYKHGDYQWDGLNPSGDHFCTVYKAPGQIITSKRWEVAREGIEDYELLFLLREAIARAKARGVSRDELAAAEKLLAELPIRIHDVLEGTGRRLPLTVDSVPLYQRATAAVQQARRRIAEACVRLNGAK